MPTLRRILALTLLGLLGAGTGAAAGPRALGGIDERPDAVIDLATREGVALVQGQWRYADARIVETDFRAPGPDLRPSGAPVKTHDYTPHAGAADFDDSAWDAIAPESLEARRGTGRLSFNWYRARVTIPSRVGPLDPTCSPVVREIVGADYAEVRGEGHRARRLGQTGGSLLAGLKPPHRGVLPR